MMEVMRWTLGDVMMIGPDVTMIDEILAVMIGLDVTMIDEVLAVMIGQDGTMIDEILAMMIGLDVMIRNGATLIWPVSGQE